MATDDGSDALSPVERRLVEILAVLAAEEVATRGDFPLSIVRRLRRQRDTRLVVTVGAGVLVAAATGLMGLFPRTTGEETRR